MNNKDYIEKEKKNNFNSMNKIEQIVEKKDIEEKEEKKQDLKKIKKEKIQINKKEDNSLEKSLSSESSERKEEVKHKKKKKNSKGNIFNILKNSENKNEKKMKILSIIKNENEKEKEEEEFKKDLKRLAKANSCKLPCNENLNSIKTKSQEKSELIENQENKNSHEEMLEKMKHEHEIELEKLKLEFSLNQKLINLNNNASRSLRKEVFNDYNYYYKINDKEENINNNNISPNNYIKQYNEIEEESSSINLERKISLNKTEDNINNGKLIHINNQLINKMMLEHQIKLNNSLKRISIALQQEEKSYDNSFLFNDFQMMNNYMNNYTHENKMNVLKNIYNNKKENDFKPRQVDSNYLKINIKNNENDDINKALNNFIKKLKDKIKQKYEQIDIKISFKEEKDYSFNIYYQIQPMNINFDDIEFLDDEFEDKMKNPQQFEINVELIEGDKNIFLINKINEYYLIFKGISVDKEGFYEHVNILKEIVKYLYI